MGSQGAKGASSSENWRGGTVVVRTMDSNNESYSFRQAWFCCWQASFRIIAGKWNWCNIQITCSRLVAAVLRWSQQQEIRRGLPTLSPTTHAFSRFKVCQRVVMWVFNSRSRPHPFYLSIHLPKYYNWCKRMIDQANASLTIKVLIIAQVLKLSLFGCWHDFFSPQRCFAWCTLSSYFFLIRRKIMPSQRSFI